MHVNIYKDTGMTKTTKILRDWIAIPMHSNLKKQEKAT